MIRVWKYVKGKEGRVSDVLFNIGDKGEESQG